MYDSAKASVTDINDANCCKDPFVPTCGETIQGGSAFDSCSGTRVYDSAKDDATTPNDANCCKDPFVQDPFVPTCGKTEEGGSAFNSCIGTRVYDATQADTEQPDDAKCCRDKFITSCSNLADPANHGCAAGTGYELISDGWMCDRLEVWTSYAASRNMCGDHCTSQPSYRANYFFWEVGNCLCVEKSTTITPVCTTTTTTFGYYTKKYTGEMTVGCSDIFLTRCGDITECEVKNGVCVYKSLVQTPDPAPAPAPAPCGLEEGKRVCPEQLNAEGFINGSIHTKLSGWPQQAKKWYKATHAQNTIDPSGSAYLEKPYKDHWGVKLQYCRNPTNQEEGTGGPYTTTTCDTDGVDFYQGGCASDMGVPQNIAGECPMIYSLETALDKETEADNFVESAGSACDSVDPSQCCSTNGCALDGPTCYEISNHPGRQDSCGGGGGPSCNEAICSDHLRTEMSPCASVGCGYDSSSGQCSCARTDPEPVIGSPGSPGTVDCSHYTNHENAASACNDQAECSWDGTNCIANTGTGANPEPFCEGDTTTFCTSHSECTGDTFCAKKDWVHDCTTPPSQGACQPAGQCTEESSSLDGLEGCCTEISISGTLCDLHGDGGYGGYDGSYGYGYDDR